MALAGGGVSGFVDEEAEVFEGADVLLELLKLFCLFGGDVLEVMSELEGFLFEEKKCGGGKFGGAGGGVLVDLGGGEAECFGRVGGRGKG